MEGWIKLHRSFLDKGYFSKSEYVHLWVYLLMNANHAEKEVLINGKIETLKPGQLLTGRNAIALKTGISHTSIERILKVFENGQQIGQQTTNKFRIITILNWDKFQVADTETDSKRTTSGQQADTNKNVKNEKNINTLSSAEPTCPHLEIIEVYNATLPTLTQVKPHLWSGTRKKHLQARWRERDTRQNLEWWRELFEHIRDDCPFLVGKNDRGWRADLGWIVKAENFAKILEGKYDSG